MVCCFRSKRTRREPRRFELPILVLLTRFWGMLKLSEEGIGGAKRMRMELVFLLFDLNPVAIRKMLLLMMHFLLHDRDNIVMFPTPQCRRLRPQCGQRL